MRAAYTNNIQMTQNWPKLSKVEQFNETSEFLVDFTHSKDNCEIQKDPAKSNTAFFVI